MGEQLSIQDVLKLHCAIHQKEKAQLVCLSGREFILSTKIKKSQMGNLTPKFPKSQKSMNTLLEIKDIVQYISQYSHNVYCKLRLLNHEVKRMIDEVLPSGGSRDSHGEIDSFENGKRKHNLRHLGKRRRTTWREAYLQHKFARLDCVKESKAAAGWKLWNLNEFDDWIDAMRNVFRKRRFGPIVQRFCRNYLKQQQEQVVTNEVLGLLCMTHQNDYVRELWEQGRLSANCLGEISMMGDFELFKSVYHERKDEISTELLTECIRNATRNQCWEITKYLLEKYSDCVEMKECARDLFVDAVEGEAFSDLDPTLRKDKELFLELVENGGNILMYADDSLKKDWEIVLEAIRENADSLEFADPTLRKDKAFILEAMRIDGNAFEFVDESLKKDREIVLEAVRNGGLLIVDESLKYDKEIALESVKLSGRMLRVSLAFQKDRDVVLEAVRNHGPSLAFADESLRKDKDIVLASVKQNPKAFEFADESLKKDKEFFLQLVKIDECLLDYADETLKRDRTFILAALSENEFILEFAHESLLKSKEFMIAAVSVNGNALMCAHDALKKDMDIVLPAIRQNGTSLRYTDISLRNDKQVVLEAVQQSGLALEYAHYSLCHDEEVVLAALEQNPDAMKFVSRVARPKPKPKP